MTAPLSEKEWQRTVTDTATAHRWMLYHTHDSRHSPEGFPDLVIVKGPWIVYAELKTEKGRLTKAQADWLEALAGAGAEVHVWRPSDWPRVFERLSRRLP